MALRVSQEFVGNWRNRKLDLLLSLYEKAFDKFLIAAKYRDFKQLICEKGHHCKIIDFHRDRETFYKHINSDVIGDGPIDYIEFGVFEGNSISCWSQLNRHAESRFWGFDSFEGLPEDWVGFGVMRHKKGTFDVGGDFPALADERVTFIKGWFQETVVPFVRTLTLQNRLVIHMDADLYSSTLYALMHLAPFMSAGTIILFDEFSDLEHEFSAFLDFTKASGLDFEIIAARSDLAKVAIRIS